jgi:predicted O-linked N-acetylglucosamine transferase (SPINDLY family)
LTEPSLETAVRLHAAGRRAEATQIYAAILQREPRNFHALYFLGFAAYEDGNFERAVHWISQAVRVNPHSADAQYNLGCALQNLQRHAEALPRFDSALAIRPDYDSAWTNRGATLLAMRRRTEAIVSFDHALRLNPRDAEALSNRAAALFELQQYESAAVDYLMLLGFAPEFPDAIGNLALAQASSCSWSNAETDRDRIRAAIRSDKSAISPHGSVLLLDRPEDQLLCARRWAARHAPYGGPLATRDYGHQRLRIAYVGADFHLHATSLLLTGVLERHDREEFEVFAFSFGPDDGSALRHRIVQACDHFVDVQALGDAAIARDIAKSEIDIAIDLKGYTQGARPGIFAFRPAPIQLNYLGHPGTMGADFIDYILADEVVIPRDQQRFYSEKVVYLPGCYQANDDKRLPSIRPVTRAQVGLPQSGFVFCCFNQPAKFTREIFAIWMRLLHRVQGSVLWLLDVNATASANLKRAAASAEVDPQRLIFAPRADSDFHLARQSHADLFLDTLPCCAHTTASDALWAGLPMLTIRGTTFAGRVAASLLTALDLSELIAESLSDYEDRAIGFAREPEWLAAVKAKLTARRDSRLPFDTARFTRNLEEAYREMCRRFQRGFPAASFSVAHI